jgi:hypothetical protein
VESTGDGSTLRDLGKDSSRLGHDRGHHFHGVGTLARGLSETVGHGVLGGKDSGVNLSDLVLAWAWDNGTLDTESSSVSTSITSLEEKY